MSISGKTVIADLLKKVRVQEVLEEEDFSSFIIRSTLDGMYIFDLDYVITLWNPAMERISGMKKEQVLGRDVFECFPFFKKYQLENLILDPLKGVPAAETEIPFEIPETGKRGFARRISRPLRDENGKVVGAINIVQEITERKQAQDEIVVRRRAEERLKFLSEAGMLLSGTLDYKQVLDRILHLITRHFSAWTKLRLLREDGSIQMIAGHEDPALAEELMEMERRYPPTEDMKEGPLWILRHGGYHFIPRTHDVLDAFAKDERHRELMLKMYGYICVPLMAGGRIFGTLSLMGTRQEFTEEDLSLAQDLSRWVALALYNARLYSQAVCEGK